eukprot:gene38215-51617_t
MTDWTRTEVGLIVDDYLSMLASELAGAPYNKTAHRRALKLLLNDRSDQSIEFKHCNISAALLDAGFPYIDGYKPRANYQALLGDVLAERMSHAAQLQEVAVADADRPMIVPEVDDILAVLTAPPKAASEPVRASEPSAFRLTTNYIEREARNRSLGLAGENFVLNFERARLIQAGQEVLAGRIEHTSQVRGDHEGYDILSFEASGAERLIEVKTTKEVRCLVSGLSPLCIPRETEDVRITRRHRSHLSLVCRNVSGSSALIEPASDRPSWRAAVAAFRTRPTITSRSFAAWFYAHHQPVLTQFMLLITHWHSILGVSVMTAALGVRLYLRQQHHWLRLLVLSVVGGMLLNAALKQVFQRPR